ncbi:circadian clock KaiB family protein [Methylotuvimicrobium sp. KM2]|uniref:circadian clock KaiB family protein n=1 Tax=Methylotuvimicrobium sp. KM2 TaxID=3133976 RepID=UPI003100F574
MNDNSSSFETLQTSSDKGLYVLRLYIAGNTPQSTRAIENLKQLCESRLQGRYELTIVDLHQMPDAGQDERIICAPTLVKQQPPPVRRLTGDLSNTDRVLRALDITQETI